MSSSAGTSCTDAEEDAEDVENEVVGTRPASFARYPWSSPSSSSPTPSSFTTRRRRGRAATQQSSTAVRWVSAHHWHISIKRTPGGLCQRVLVAASIA
ncbi:hypothetical protein HZH66_008104 [Vespula vulgaris]|uniref:Uncharacterized protein n=1 Tax=Vespula vulgaris TaxID=7454 RepID=A0A834JVK7_VESVU|nr:hypothetical protein HZH66_008104 [Vespula vulgaris]